VGRQCGASFRSGGQWLPHSRLRPATQTRGNAGTMVDVTAGQGVGRPGGRADAQRNRRILKRGDIAAGARHPHHPGGAGSCRLLDGARPVPGDSRSPVDPDPDGRPLSSRRRWKSRRFDPSADFDMLRLSLNSLDAADPVARMRAPTPPATSSRRWQLRDGRQFRIGIIVFAISSW